MCPVCNGQSSIEDIYKCFVCCEVGTITGEAQIVRAISNASKYNVSYLIKSNAGFENETMISSSICELRSSSYPQHILNRAQDFFQLELLKKELAFMDINEKVISTARTYMTTSEGLVELEDYIEEVIEGDF